MLSGSRIEMYALLYKHYNVCIIIIVVVVVVVVAVVFISVYLVVLVHFLECKLHPATSFLTSFAVLSNAPFCKSSMLLFTSNFIS